MNLWASQQQYGLNYQAKEEEQKAGAAIVEDESEEELQEASTADSCNHKEELVKDSDEPADKKGDQQDEPTHCVLIA